jgi:MFS family permease
MLMDVSSEMIHALLPAYLVVSLGASALAVGFLEGVAEATASITKVFSGAISDWIGKRKLLAAIGYGLAAFTKPVFPLAQTIGWVFAARFVDRIGKGIRGAPRDALIADLTPPESRGAAFGLRQSLDTVGAFVGPLLAIALMWLTAENIPFVFWIAVIPAFAAFALILFFVHDPPHVRGMARVPLSRQQLARLPALYWSTVAVGAVLALARFSEAFLVLRAQELGVALTFIPAILVVMNVAYSASSYPAGVLADRMSRGTLLATGFAALIAADLILAFVPATTGLMVGVMLWGLHMGLTQGLLAALVADAAPASLRGTAFGVFNLVIGFAMLIASTLAGWLWSTIGSQFTFIASASFAGLGLAGLVLLLTRQRRTLDRATQ